MAADSPPSITATPTDVEQVEDVGYFFRFLGGIRFVDYEGASAAKGYTRSLAVSSTYGGVVFADAKGKVAVAVSSVWQARQHDERWDNSLPADLRSRRLLPQACTLRGLRTSSPSSPRMSAPTSKRSAPKLRPIRTALSAPPDTIVDPFVGAWTPAGTAPSTRPACASGPPP